MTENNFHINHLELREEEIAELALAAAAMGVSFAYYLGFLVALAFYGPTHPRVVETNKGAVPSVNGPEIQGGANAVH